MFDGRLGKGVGTRRTGPTLRREAARRKQICVDWGSNEPSGQDGLFAAARNVRAEYSVRPHRFLATLHLLLSRPQAQGKEGRQEHQGAGQPEGHRLADLLESHPPPTPARGARNARRRTAGAAGSGQSRPGRRRPSPSAPRGARESFPGLRGLTNVPFTAPRRRCTCRRGNGRGALPAAGRRASPAAPGDRRSPSRGGRSAGGSPLPPPVVP